MKFSYLFKWLPSLCLAGWVTGAFGSQPETTAPNFEDELFSLDAATMDELVKVAAQHSSIGATLGQIPLSASDKDYASLTNKYVFTHHVSDRKLKSILDKGELGFPQREDFFRGKMAELGLPFDEATLAKIAESPLKYYFEIERKLFLDVTSSMILEAQRAKPYRNYRAMLIYSAEIVRNRNDYFMSSDQANLPFNSEEDFVPGQMDAFISKHVHSNSDNEVKFLSAPISNRHILALYVDKTYQNEFLRDFSAYLIASEGSCGDSVSYLLRINQRLTRPVKFVDFYKR